MRRGGMFFTHARTCAVKIITHTPSTLILEHRPVFYWAFGVLLAGVIPALLLAFGHQDRFVGSAIAAVTGVLVCALWGRISTVTFDRVRGTVDVVRRAPWSAGRRVRLPLADVLCVRLDLELHRAKFGVIRMYSVVLESKLGERIPLTSGESFGPARLAETVETIRAFLRSAP